MSQARSGKIVAVGTVWLVILAAAVGIYKWVVDREKDALIRQTGSRSRYGEGQRVRLALDSFSGYAIFRSPQLAEELAAAGIELELVEDGADYARRLTALQRDEIDLALFTIDALLKTCADAQDLPATIVMLVDESRGADALVAHGAAVRDIDALNRADAQIVVTPDSPSETLVRVVRAHFNLSDLPADCWSPLGGAEEVYREFLAADRSAPRAYALWEPFVAKALEQTGALKLVDSSQFKGYIVDALVAQRRFLRDHEEKVRAVIEAYQRVFFRVRGSAGGMPKMVTEDAAAVGERITADQAEQLAAGIWWKNTRENYAHLGILAPAEIRGAQHLEDMIRNITGVLLATGAIRADPTNGEPGRLFFSGILADLHAADFRPSVLGATENGEGIREETPLPVLDDEGWNRLIAVGTLRMDRLIFPPGRADLTLPSRRSLEKLLKTLEDWPRFYLQVCGHASARGDLDQNRVLARRRAEAAVDFLVDNGVARHRLRATGEEPRRVGGEEQKVTFVLCELPY